MPAFLVTERNSSLGGPGGESHEAPLLSPVSPTPAFTNRILHLLS